MKLKNVENKKKEKTRDKTKTKSQESNSYTYRHSDGYDITITRAKFSKNTAHNVMNRKAEEKDN